VLLVQASERDEGPSQVVASTHSGSGIIAPGWHTRRRGCRFQNRLIALVGGLQGT
jgi:hypothetical protein